MLPVRRSSVEAANADFLEDKEARSESNTAWLARRRAQDPAFGQAGDVVLLGGAGLADFRVRVAQSHARDDLTPSYWSLTGVIGNDGRMLTAPLWPLTAPDRIPVTNGIRSLPLSRFGNARTWPNIAVIRFPGTHGDPVDCITRLTSQRSIVDIPSLVLTWLGFVWGAGATGNPLLTGFGVPSAVLVEAAFGMTDVELTPGLATASSCPEAIYQAAKWWHRYYQQAAGDEHGSDHHPVGSFVLRQREATYREPEPGI